MKQVALEGFLKKTHIHTHTHTHTHTHIHTHTQRRIQDLLLEMELFVALVISFQSLTNFTNNHSKGGVLNASR